MSIIVAAIITGFLTGILSGLLGIGGGAILILMMVFVMGLTQHTAQGISLTAMVPSTLISAWYFHKDKLIDYRAAAYMGLGSVIGILFSANFVQYIPAEILTRIFGVFAITLGTRNFIMASKKKKPTRSETADESKPK